MICSLEVDAKPSHVLTLSLRCRIDVSVSLLQWLCGSVHLSYHLLTHPEGRNGQETGDSITRKRGEEGSVSAPLAWSPHLANRELPVK